MVTNFDISQEIFSIDVLRALKSSLKHRRKHVLSYKFVNYTECLLNSPLPNTHASFNNSKRLLSESVSLGSHFRENLQQTDFSVVLPASGIISLQQSLIESKKLNFMMK